MLKEMRNLSFGEFTLDQRLRELRQGDAVLSIPGKAFDLLSYMAANPGRLLTKSELLDAVWPETVVEESNLSQNVFLLRKVLGADGGPIKTRPGYGYQFTAQVTEIEEAAKPAESMSSLTVEATETRVVVRETVEERGAGLSRLGLWVIWMVAAIFVAALAIAGWVWRQRWLDSSGGAPVQVVIAPMEGTSGDAVLDRSLVQAMRMDLAQSPYVTVVPASSLAARLGEMHRKPEELANPAVSREVCERTNSQAVLSGSLAKAGEHYLITEEASSCVDGAVIGQTKYEASKDEDLPHAMDELAARLRQKLGESRRSIARFNTPLFPQNTPSLEALKALTQGIEESRKGDGAKAITFYKLAIAADPGFAWAYYDLATTDSNVGDYAASREAIAKAYSLRDSASKQQAFAIAAVYNALLTEDLYESLRIYQDWAALYPNDALAWNGMDYVLANLGRHQEAAVSSRRALTLVPQNQNYLDEQAIELMQSGNSTAAKQTLDRAIAMHFDDNYIRARYLELAYLLHDDSLLHAQRQWSKEHPETAIVLVTEMEIAMAEGRFADAQKLAARCIQLYREQGIPEAGEQFAKTEAVSMMEAGDMSGGKRLFSVSPANVEEGSEVLGLAYSGNFSAAQSALRAAKAKYPEGTLWNLYWTPLTQAVIALQQNKPREATAALEMARPVQDRELVVPWLRGSAYLAAGQPDLAERDYRDVVTHPEIDPTSPTISLSWLGLGRALAAQGKRAAAMDAYKHFLGLWSHADPDAMDLKQAKQELAKLDSGSSNELSR
jgi:eukaryotic-like serine/threonine-protein kinase